MSWCRWGSICSNTVPEYIVNAECVARPEGCPGSSIYVYEGAKFTCCVCSLRKGDEFECETTDEMYAHLLEHDAAGHHVRRSLLEYAHGREPEVTVEWKEFRDSVRRSPQ